MDYFTKLNLKPLQILKIVGVAVFAVILLAFLFRVLGSSFSTARVGLDTYREESAASYGYAKGGTSVGSPGMMADTAQLSARNIAPMPPTSPQATSGNDAEAFEVRSYQGTIETRRLVETCGEITALKRLDYVIFEQANQEQRTCYFTFKVQKDRVPEILAKIKALNPKNLTEDTQTIKRQISDFTSELEILEKKRISIDETLENAIRAYDEITQLATRTQDAGSLAKIIDSKIQIIERLTQERLSINEQLDRLSRAKAEQLDRLEYTYFSINVFETKFVDAVELKDSWREAVRSFVRDLNKVAQDLTVNLALILIMIVQYALYFFILLVVVKYAWKWTKAFWKS
ncbi:hypothetical protein KBD34_02940 [Patescibacteria group bacterium]|nr:hypothetical protein [Patescibacteria group bacterium]